MPSTGETHCFVDVGNFLCSCRRVIRLWRITPAAEDHQFYRQKEHLYTLQILVRQWGSPNYLAVKIKAGARARRET